MPIFDTDGAPISYEMLGRIAPDPDSEVTVTGRLYAEIPKGASLVVIGRESSRAYQKDGEDRQWTEVAVDAFGVVPKGQQSSPRPSPQGEQWNNVQQYGSGTGGGAQWPTAAQPGSGYDNQVPF